MEAGFGKQPNRQQIMTATSIEQWPVEEDESRILLPENAILQEG